MSFLGQGWAFLPAFGGDSNPTQMVSDEEDIRESLNILMSTRKGERVLQPDYGVDLAQYVFHNMNLTMRTQLKEVIEKAVLFYEPRISLDSVQFDMSSEFDGLLRIELKYTIKLTNERSNLVFPYYYEEHL
ncbi:MAG: GPW/gp25 family protein [Paludibacteraceae bacterium]|nr:GPW/gp25 family protein [Paludibacteraceae bacterium]